MLRGSRPLRSRTVALTRPSSSDRLATSTGCPPQTLFENLMDREPALRLFLFSPAQQAIEFVGRALPAVRPEPKFTDEVPLMRPIVSRIPLSDEPPPSAALAASGVLLIATGAGVIAFGGRRTRQGDRA